MKKALVLFLRGLTGILVGIAEWFTVVLGMKDESKYGRFIRRVVGGSFAFMMLMMAIAAGWGCWQGISDYFELKTRAYSQDEYYEESPFSVQYLSRNAKYYSHDYWGDGMVKTNDGKTTITGIHWIAKPLGNDSLICYNNGDARGYFNKFTGEIVIKPRYRHAWIFSEGLASVDENGWIKFIDATGRVVIDLKQPYLPGTDGYVFHNNHCVVNGDSRDRFGLIDKQGKWALKPDYFSIVPMDTFWIVSNGKEQSVISDGMNTVIPFTAGRFWLESGSIYGVMRDHTIRRYNLQGEITENFCITSVEPMVYSTPELFHAKTKHYDADGNLISESEDSDAYHVQATAKCKRYEAASGWYGLMAPDGEIITPPSFSDITAIGYDMYLCKGNTSDGVLLNGKGQKVE